jgi:acetamidase/formamidase
VRVPFEPFCGVMGVAPREPGRLPTFDPGVHGGNVDVRQLTSGAKALLPVFNEGAGFATGDGHAAQGDGEVCCTAIEAPLTATMRFRVRRDLTVHELQIITPNRSTRAGAQGYHRTTGHGPDLERCAQDAVRHMVDWLEREHGLQRDHAYCLCSVAGDLKIGQAVMGAKVVSFWMPLSVLRA